MTVPNSFSPGVDTSFASKLNSNFTQLDLDLVASTTTSSTSGSTTTATASIAASAVYQYVVVIADINWFGGQSGGVAATVAVSIWSGAAGSETSKHTYTMIGGTGGANALYGSQSTLVFYLVPTSGELSGGFNVQVKGVTSGAGTYQFNNLWVLGR
jgi:hypothetical protein